MQSERFQEKSNRKKMATRTRYVSKQIVGLYDSEYLNERS